MTPSDSRRGSQATTTDAQATELDISEDEMSESISELSPIKPRRGTLSKMDEKVSTLACVSVTLRSCALPTVFFPVDTNSTSRGLYKQGVSHKSV